MPKEEQESLTPESNNARTKKVEDFLLNPDKVVFESLEEFQGAITELLEFFSKLDPDLLETLQGEDGVTPVLGVDFMTEDDVKGIERFILERISQVTKNIPTRTSMVNFLAQQVAKIPRIKGDAGSTPVKGVDYFDGEPGKPGSPDTPDQVMAKLKSVKKNKRLKTSDIRGLDHILRQLVDAADDLEDLKKAFTKQIVVMTPGGDGSGSAASHYLGLFASVGALPGSGLPGDYADVDTGIGSDVTRYIWDDDDTKWVEQGAVSLGDVVGPGSSTDKAIPRFNGTNGKNIQDSNVTISDADKVEGASEFVAGNIPLYEILGNRVSTGVIDGAGELAANVDTTKFDISDGSGVVVDAFATPGTPVFTKVTWSGLTAITPTHAATFVTFIAINVSGAVVQQATQFTTEQRKSLIVLGTINTVDGTNVNSTSDNSHSIGDGYLASALTLAVGMINIFGNNFSEASTNLTIRKEAGNTFEENINRDINAKDPHFKTSAVDTGVTFIYIYSDGSGGFTTELAQTDINPDQYDDGSGSLATVANNKYTNQIVYFFPDSDTVVIQYGETIYNNLAEAEADIPSLVFTTLDPSLTGEAIRTIISIKKGTTNLATAADVVFSNTGKFGFGSGGSSAAGGTFQDMQDTYNNSVSPEVTTDTTRGAVSYKRGSAADTDDVVEVLNAAGTQKYAVTGEGKVNVENSINESKGADIASATTTNIGAATGNFVDITGTVTITGFGTIKAGVERTVLFDGILILTHHATQLILPTGSNITTAAGDVAKFRSLGAGNWVCVGYMRADGTALSGAGIDFPSLGVIPEDHDNTHSLDLEASSSQYASITDASQVGLDITGDITVEAWIKPESISTGDIVVAKRDDSTDRAYSFFYNATAISLVISDDGANTDFLTVPYVLSTGAWTHVAWTWKASTSTYELFVNGVSVGTDTGSITSIFNSTAPFSIGCLFSAGSPTSFVDGLLDEVRVWSELRTPTQIAENYQKELLGSETNLEAYFQLENDYTDKTANGNDLTAVNSPVFSTDTSSSTWAALKLLGTEEVIVNEGGVVKKTTAQDIADLVELGSGPEMAIYQDQKTTNTAGGTVGTGSYATRVLNTEVYNNSSNISRSGNIITLLAGVYMIKAEVPCYDTGNFRSKLFNTSDSANAIIGSAGYSDTSDPCTVHSIIVGIVNISATKSFDIRTRAASGSAAQAGGREVGYGDIEVYTTVTITKIG